MEETQEQYKKQYDWLKGYQFVKGKSGNPGGRPKGAKSLKTFAREFLESLPDDEKIEYLKAVDPKIVWEMSEGKPKQDVDLNAHLTISEVLDQLAKENAQEPGEQTMADQQPIQD